MLSCYDVALWRRWPAVSVSFPEHVEHLHASSPMEAVTLLMGCVGLSHVAYASVRCFDPHVVACKPDVISMTHAYTAPRPLVFRCWSVTLLPDVAVVSAFETVVPDWPLEEEPR